MFDEIEPRPRLQIRKEIVDITSAIVRNAIASKSTVKETTRAFKRIKARVPALHQLDELASIIWQPDYDKVQVHEDSQGETLFLDVKDPDARTFLAAIAMYRTVEIGAENPENANIRSIQQDQAHILRIELIEMGISIPEITIEDLVRKILEEQIDLYPLPF
jgi:hypothetical protein